MPLFYEYLEQKRKMAKQARQSSNPGMSQPKQAKEDGYQMPPYPAQKDEMPYRPYSQTQSPFQPTTALQALPAQPQPPTPYTNTAEDELTKLDRLRRMLQGGTNV